MEFLDVNDDCLQLVCQYLDAESIVALAKTCVRMKDIAEANFKRVTSYHCYLNSIESEKRAIDTISKIDKHLSEVTLHFEHKYKGTENIFKTMTRSISEHLREFDIMGKICCVPFKTLAPIFSQLEILTIGNLCRHEDCIPSINLSSLCPNLRRLSVSGRGIITSSTARIFRRLEHLDIDADPTHPLSTLFSANRQIKKLGLRNHRKFTHISMHTLTTFLPNLEETHLDVQVINDPTPAILAMNSFLNLHTLWLCSIPVSKFNEIVTNLVTLKKLKDICVHCDLTRMDSEYFMGQESLIRIATDLPQLESFVTSSIDWTSETVTEFVRQANNLISFEFWSGSSNFIVTPQFIRELATIRNSITSSLNQPLALKMYRIDSTLKQVFNELEVSRFIKLPK